MWYHPVVFHLTRRDVIGAWIICLAIAMVFFGYPVVSSELDAWTGDLNMATAGPGPELTGKQRPGSEQIVKTGRLAQTEDIGRRSVLVLAGKFVGAHPNTVGPSRQKFSS
jgi:hypothetical protein